MNRPIPPKPAIAPASFRIRREPVNSDNAPIMGHKVPKAPKVDISDMPTQIARSSGELPLPWDESDNRYFGLEEDIVALGGQITRMGAMCAVGRKTDDPTHNWQKPDDSDIAPAMAQVTHKVPFTIPTAAESDILAQGTPKRPTWAELAEVDNEGNRPHVLKYREALKAYKRARRVREGTVPGTVSMSADIPVNLDTVDNSDDVLKERTGNGGRILVKVSPSVHSDGKWGTRTRTVYSDNPDKGHIFHYSVIGWQVGPIGTNRTLVDMPDMSSNRPISDMLDDADALVQIGRFMPYGAKDVKSGGRRNPDTGIAPSDGKTDISGKVLNMDGTNPRQAKAAEAARAAKAAKRAAKATPDRASVLSDLAALAAKVHNENDGKFLPMTRAEREIHDKQG